jgi:threonine dehydrogenase-like Zn-dependent dehydrogenase
MTALVYNGVKGVAISEVEDAKIEGLTDVVIKLTTTNICASALEPAA